MNSDVGVCVCVCVCECVCMRARTHSVVSNSLQPHGKLIDLVLKKI